MKKNESNNRAKEKHILKIRDKNCGQRDKMKKSTVINKRQTGI